jgi:hydrogenase/urease accessory protein HupE
MIVCRAAMLYRRQFVSRWLSAVVVIVGFAVSFSTARAHSPFDSTARVTVLEQNLEAALVVGSGLTEKLLENSGVTSIPNVGRGITLPTSQAIRLFEIEAGGTNLPATQLRVLSDGLESTFVVTYPRPIANTFRLRATFAKHLPDGGFSALVVTDEQNQMLGSHIVRAGSETVDFALPQLASTPVEAIATMTPLETIHAPTLAAAPAPVAKPQPSFAEYFQMGVHHILTGPDHLLFLCGLLVVARNFCGVLAIVTCFTLAHSVTLGLAALNVVSLSAKIVEPIIAASIIFVGVENFRRDHGSLKARCWLAFGFGLIHGFGLADALRHAGLGNTIKAMAAGLFSFNVGVEAGQLAVAAVFLAVLWQLRKHQVVARYTTPVISALIIALGGWWLVQRTLL